MTIDDTEVLPLFPWEERSVVRRICAPPNTTASNRNRPNRTTAVPSSTSSGSVASSGIGIDTLQPYPAKCCIGSSSKGGAVTFRPHICNLGAEPYERAARHARHFLSRNPIVEPSETLCDVCRIVDQLARRNWTMTFQGDSTMNQMIDALDCALRRRGYPVITEMKSWRRQEGLFWRRGISAVHRIRVWPPTATARTNGPPVVLRFYIMYRPLKKNMSEIHHIMQRSDVLIFDHGLHYTFDQRAEFLSEMTDLLGTLLPKSRNNSTSDSDGDGYVSPTAAPTRPKLVAWRETVSQHFDTPTGDFAEWTRSAPEGCVEHPYLRNGTAHAHDKLTWYQEYMMRAARELDLEIVNAGDATLSNSIGSRPSFHSSLVVLPFTQFSRPLHYLHPGGFDCTHICYTPFTWMPVWRSLRRAIDEIALEHAAGSSHIVRGYVGYTYVISSEWAIFAGGLFICGALLLWRNFHCSKLGSSCM